MRIRRILDLSHPVDSAAQGYPGDPVPRFTHAATIEHSGYNLLHISMGSQSGTHCDAPYHFAADGPGIDAMDLTLFAGPAVVADVTGRPARHRISWAELAPLADRLCPSTVLLLHTGWSRYYGTPAYYDHPFLDAEACRRILDTGARTICLDTINIDETPDDLHAGDGFPVHRMMAAANGVIGENFTNLEGIDFPDPLVAFFPIKLTGADGAPVRAVAMHLDG